MIFSCRRVAARQGGQAGREEGHRGMMGEPRAGCGCCGLWHSRRVLSVWRSVPCHSGGLVGWVRSGCPAWLSCLPSEPSPPIIVWPLWPSVPLASQPQLDLQPYSRRTAHWFSPESSTSCNYSTARVLAVAFNAATTCGQKQPARLPGCQCPCRRSDRQRLIGETKRNAACVPAAGALVSLYLQAAQP